MTILTLFTVSNSFGAVSYASFYGLFCGARQSLMVPMYADLFGTENLGKVTSIMIMGLTSAAGFGPLMFGLSKDHTGSYSPAILTIALFTLISSVPLFFTKATKEHRNT